LTFLERKIKLWGWRNKPMRLKYWIECKANHEKGSIYHNANVLANYLDLTIH
jgi:hypothetical protein